MQRSGFPQVLQPQFKHVERRELRIWRPQNDNDELCSDSKTALVGEHLSAGVTDSDLAARPVDKLEK